MFDYKLLNFHMDMTLIGMNTRKPKSTHNVPSVATIRNRILNQNQIHNYSTFSNADVGEGCHGLTLCYPL